MKKTFVLAMTIVAVLFIACNNQDKKGSDNPYVGAWELTYTKYVFPDSIAETSQFAYPTVKLMTNKHYAFGRQDGLNKIKGGGGEYSIKGDVVITYPKYHSSINAGDSLVLKSKLEGDLWKVSFSTTYNSKKVDAIETWKRIKE